MASKIKKIKITVEVEEWIKPRVLDRVRKKGMGNTFDSFINDAIVEKLHRSPLRLPEDRPSSGFVKVNTRLESFVNEKLKDKDTLGHRTKESYINEAIIEKMSRDLFFVQTTEKFDAFLSRATHLLSESLNSSQFADTIEQMNERLVIMGKPLDSIELKALETELRYSLKESEDKLKMLYLIALDKDLPNDLSNPYLLQDLIEAGFLEQQPDLAISLSEVMLAHLHDV